MHPNICHIVLNLSNNTIKSSTLITVIANAAPVSMQCCHGHRLSWQHPDCFNVFGFGFDVDSLCSCVRVIVCIVCLFEYGFFFPNNSADVNIFLRCSDIKSFVFMWLCSDVHLLNVTTFFLVV